MKPVKAWVVVNWGGQMWYHESNLLEPEHRVFLHRCDVPVVHPNNGRIARVLITEIPTTKPKRKARK